MYYRSRYYMPAWGRFIGEDPIGVLGGINRYVYVNDNPVMSADPDGKIAPLIIAGAILLLFLASEHPAGEVPRGYHHRNAAEEISAYLTHLTQLGCGGVLSHIPPEFGFSAPSDPPGGPRSIYHGLSRREITKRFIGPEQNKLLGEFFGDSVEGAAYRKANFEVPKGLTREALEAYAELARRAIAGGIDKLGVQAQRLELLDRALELLK